MPFRIGIIGAGWYGCHLASSLASLGFDVKLFERHSRVLHEASGNNQFRLHLGFHYARHHGTRQQSRDGFLRFIERYPTLSAPIENNIYAVPKNDSLIDFHTYKMIMASSGIDFTEINPNSSYLSNIEGAINTPERVIMLNRARSYFERRLHGILHLDTKVSSVEENDSGIKIQGMDFDYMIDATWGKLSKSSADVFYEPTILLYYESNSDFPAITMVDGPLFSIYPTEDRKIYTLSSVVHTPLGTYLDPQAAQAANSAVNSTFVDDKRNLMEQQVARNVPSFKDCFDFVGVQLSLKTKLRGKSDDRSCYVNQRGRIFSVMSGKIDTIFHATERILSMIEEQNSRIDPEPKHNLRDDIFSMGD